MKNLNFAVLSALLLIVQVTYASTMLPTDFTSSETPIATSGNQSLYLYVGDYILPGGPGPLKCFYTFQVKRENEKAELAGIGDADLYFYDLDKQKGILNYASVNMTDSKKMQVAIGNLLTSKRDFTLSLDESGKLSSAELKYHDRAASMVLSDDPQNDYTVRCANLKNFDSTSEVNTRIRNAAFAIMRIDAFKNGFPPSKIDRKFCYSFPPQSAKIELTDKMTVISGLANAGLKDGSSCKGNWSTANDINRGTCSLDGLDLDITDRIDFRRTDAYPRAIEVSHDGKSIFFGFCDQ